MCAKVGLGEPFLSSRSMLLWDYCGHEVAADILLASREKKQHSKAYTQFRSLDYVRTAYSNFYKSSPMNTSTSIALEANEGANKQLLDCSTNLLWFTKFMNNLGSRIGEIHKPNLWLRRKYWTHKIGYKDSIQ